MAAHTAIPCIRSQRHRVMRLSPDWDIEMRPYLKSNMTLVNYKDKVINLNDAEIKIRNRKRCNFNTS